LKLQLAILDLLTRPLPDLTEAEAKVVKQAAAICLRHSRPKSLSSTGGSSSARVRRFAYVSRKIYDRELPALYDKALFETKVESTFRHVYEAYFSDGRSV
jgi:hypothetical protein